eukprot:1631166-Pyramimonas_sp.AAC.1
MVAAAAAGGAQRWETIKDIIPDLWIRSPCARNGIGAPGGGSVAQYLTNDDCATLGLEQELSEGFGLALGRSWARSEA